jgi:hypothetical protein
MVHADVTRLAHWELTADAAFEHLTDEETEAFLRRVALEGIGRDPAKFVAYTPYLAWRTFVAPTDWIPPWADAIEVSPDFENPPLLAVTGSGLHWRRSSDYVNSVIWPVLCCAAVAGVFLSLMRRDPLLLAIVWIPVSYLIATAAVESFCPRYNAPIIPFIAVLAAVPLDALRKAAYRR